MRQSKIMMRSSSGSLKIGGSEVDMYSRGIGFVMLSLARVVYTMGHWWEASWALINIEDMDGLQGQAIIHVFYKQGIM